MKWLKKGKPFKTPSSYHKAKKLSFSSGLFTSEKKVKLGLLPLWMESGQTCPYFCSCPVLCDWEVRKLYLPIQLGMLCFWFKWNHVIWKTFRQPSDYIVIACHCIVRLYYLATEILVPIVFVTRGLPVDGIQQLMPGSYSTLVKRLRPCCFSCVLTTSVLWLVPTLLPLSHPQYVGDIGLHYSRCSGTLQLFWYCPIISRKYNLLYHIFLWR